MSVIDKDQKPTIHRFIDRIIGSREQRNRRKFESSLEKWNKETNNLSCNVYDNSNFKKIVGMGKDAVPLIYKVLLEEKKKNRATPLVYALDKIYPGVMTYNGFVTLKAACDQWTKTLEENGISIPKETEKIL